jgi:hypothetical protein
VVFVEMSGGELATYDESKVNVESQDVRHAVLWDKGNQNHRNYGIASWPAAFLIGADGKVFWQGNPNRMEARKDELENFRTLLQNQLRAADSKK